MLDIPRAKVHELLATGTLPSFRIGRVRLVLVKDVEEYVQQLRERAAAVSDEPRVSA
jgi:excisionase family DNA binding protein